MVSLIIPEKAQKTLVKNVRTRRLRLGLTQKGLAKRAGVPLSTLRKFEQKGAISLDSFLKLEMVLGGLDALAEATKPAPAAFASIDDVLEDDENPTSKRGIRT